jgi:hypothetical protein
MRATMLVLSLRATSGLSRTPAHFRFTTLQCDSDQGLCGDVTIRLELPNWGARLQDSPRPTRILEKHDQWTLEEHLQLKSRLTTDSLADSGHPFSRKLGSSEG